MIPSPPDKAFWSPLPVLLLTSFSIFLSAAVLSGCAAPAVEKRPPAEETLTPWAPTRLSDHPADQPPPLEQLSHPRRGDHSHLGGGPLEATIFLAWRLYSHSFSRVSGDTCAFSPTCSRFAVDAASLGPEGALYTFGRLQRSQLHDPLYSVDAEGFLIDPPSHYLFWRSDLGLRAHQYDIDRRHAWYIFVQAAALSEETRHD